jgi:hypothetical protein
MKNCATAAGFGPWLWAAAGRVLLLGLVTILSSCAVVTPVLSKHETLQQGSGYIAAEFTRHRSAQDALYTFVIRNVDTKLEYPMALGDLPIRQKDIHDQVLVIAVPPGCYVVPAWATVGAWGMDNHAITAAVFNTPFEVRAGTVVVLGDFSVTSDSATVTWSSKLASWSGLRIALDQNYPAFRAIPITCVVCKDDRPDAVRRETDARWARPQDPSPAQPSAPVQVFAVPAPASAPAPTVARATVLESADGPSPESNVLAIRLVGADFDMLTGQLTQSNATTPSGSTLHIAFSQGTVTVNDTSNGRHASGDYWIDKVNARLCMNNMAPQGFAQMSVCYEADRIDAQTTRLQSQSSSYYLILHSAS